MSSFASGIYYVLIARQLGFRPITFTFDKPLRSANYLEKRPLRFYFKIYSLLTDVSWESCEDRKYSGLETQQVRQIPRVKCMNIKIFDRSLYAFKTDVYSQIIRISAHYESSRIPHDPKNVKIGEKCVQTLDCMSISASKRIGSIIYSKSRDFLFRLR